MRALVIGATGLLGSNLVAALQERGHSVIAVVRSPHKAALQLDGSVEFVLADLRDTAALAAAIEDIDVVFNCAAYFREYYRLGNHSEPLRQINVEAVERLARAARRRGVRRLVQVSSSGVVGIAGDGGPGSETTAPGPDSITFRNAYFDSKLRADRALAALTVPDEAPAITTVLPGWMFGPRDAGPTGAGALVLRFLAGSLVRVEGLGSPVSDARDVAAGMVAAAERDERIGAHGERYLLAGPHRTLDEIVVNLAEVTGRPVPRRGTAEEAGIRGVRLDTLRSHPPVCSGKALRVLGIEFRPLRETLSDTIAWLREHWGDRQPGATVGRPFRATESRE